MGCKICKLKPVIKLTSSNIHLCKNCFTRYFEKKVLRTLRMFKMLKNIKVINITNDDFSEVNYYILGNLSKERRNKFIIKKGKSGKVVVSDNLDKTSSLILLSEFENKFRKDLIPIYKNIIKPLYFMHKNEIEMYGKIKNLKFKENKIPKEEKKVLNFIDEVESKYSGTKINIVKSYLDMVSK